jgi:YidC/Oxa1 family membrane protein insertase
MVNFLYTLIIYPLTEIIEFVFVFSQKVFKDTGFSILAISVSVSVLTLPLYNVAEKWQILERGIQKKLKSDIENIKRNFNGDERFMILSTYYRQNRYHPIFALRSSFGLLIQIPFFIAAYSYLTHLDALRGAHFAFFRDMGAPDALFTIHGFPVNVLPIALTAINCIAGAIYTRGFPLKEKMQIYAMALIFLVLLYTSPAGLVLYWTANNIFSLVKNCYYKISFRFKKQVIFTGISLFLKRGNRDRGAKRQTSPDSVTRCCK